MQELEKILEEMNEIKDGNRKEKIYAKYPPNSKEQEILNAYSQGYEDGTDNFYNAIIGTIREYMSAKDTDVPTNDGWIPVEEQLPDVTEGTEDPDCPEFNVMIKGASRSTTLKYSWDGTWFDDNGYLYDVIAWQPLPEPYRPERSEE